MFEITYKGETIGQGRANEVLAEEFAPLGITAKLEEADDGAITLEVTRRVRVRCSASPWDSYGKLARTVRLAAEGNLESDACLSIGGKGKKGSKEG